MPLDPIPDFIPVVGYLDDLLVLIAGLWLFLRLCLREVFLEHIVSEIAREFDGEGPALPEDKGDVGRYP